MNISYIPTNNANKIDLKEEGHGDLNSIYVVQIRLWW
jgi:hypothetical protein